MFVTRQGVGEGFWALDKVLRKVVRDATKGAMMFGMQQGAGEGVSGHDKLRRVTTRKPGSWAYLIAYGRP